MERALFICLIRGCYVNLITLEAFSRLVAPSNAEHQLRQLHKSYCVLKKYAEENPTVASEVSDLRTIIHNTLTKIGLTKAKEIFQ